MQTGHYINALGGRLVVELEREAAKKRSTVPICDHGESLWELDDQVDGGFQRVDELGSKSWSVFLVPCAGPLHILSGFPSEANPHLRVADSAAL